MLKSRKISYFWTFLARSSYPTPWQQNDKGVLWMRLSSPEDSIQGAWLIVETSTGSVVPADHILSSAWSLRLIFEVSTGMFLPVTAKSCLFARKKLMDILDEEEGIVVGWKIGYP